MNGVSIIIEEMATISIKLAKMLKQYGPLVQGYCDECGIRDCYDWECEASRMQLEHGVADRIYNYGNKYDK